MEAMRNQDNKSIIRKVTNRYISSISKDELNRCGWHGLWKALSYHQDGRGQKFTTSLYRFVDWECKRLLKRSNFSKNISLEGAKIDIPYSEGREDIEHLRECLKLLPKNESELVDMKYFREMTLEEIGAVYGYTKENARQKLARVMEKLHKIYIKE